MPLDLDRCAATQVGALAGYFGDETPYGIAAASMRRPPRISEATRAAVMRTKQTAYVVLMAATKGPGASALGVASGMPEEWRNITVSSAPPSEIPSSDPTPNTICTRPVANPRYSRGTEPMMAVWLGVLKKPWPIPVQASSSAGRLQCESTLRRIPMTKPAMITDKPIEAGRPRPMRSVSPAAREARPHGADRYPR